MRVICFTTGRENTKRGDAVIHRIRLQAPAIRKDQGPKSSRNESKEGDATPAPGILARLSRLKGVEVVSWYVMMGIGQVVTRRLPASRLREVNRILKNTAWSSYRTEFYSTYDYKAIGIAAHEKAQ